MKKLILAVTLILSVGFAGNSFAEETYSGRAVAESGRASSHASAGVTYGTVASGQAVSAVAAVPFAVLGSAGAVSSEISAGLMELATAPAGTPLPITDEVFTAGPPPDRAIQEQSRDKR